MAVGSNFIPPGYLQVVPALAFQDPATAIDFYRRAFGAVEVMRLLDPEGKVAHAEIQIGAARFMLSPEDAAYNATPQTLGGTAVILGLYVEDVDAFAEQAVAAGAQLVIPIADQFYGDRSGRLLDPFGYVWMVGTHREDVSIAEMQRRMEALYAGS